MENMRLNIGFKKLSENKVFKSAVYTKAKDLDSFRNIFNSNPKHPAIDVMVSANGPYATPDEIKRFFNINTFDILGPTSNYLVTIEYKDNTWMIVSQKRLNEQKRILKEGFSQYDVYYKWRDHRLETLSSKFEYALAVIRAERYIDLFASKLQGAILDFVGILGTDEKFAVFAVNKDFINDENTVYLLFDGNKKKYNTWKVVANRCLASGQMEEGSFKDEVPEKEDEIDKLETYEEESEKERIKREEKELKDIEDKIKKDKKDREKKETTVWKKVK